jgi:hypothetical protein
MLYTRDIWKFVRYSCSRTKQTFLIKCVDTKGILRYYIRDYEECSLLRCNVIYSGKQTQVLEKRVASFFKMKVHAAVLKLMFCYFKSFRIVVRKAY